MSYVCDCGYVIQDSADELKHLTEIHEAGWTPKSKPKVGTAATSTAGSHDVKPVAKAAETKTTSKKNVK